MAIEIQEKFQVEAPIDAVWRFVMDPHKLATCMPGVELEEVVDDRTFLGSIKVKVGAITASYKGRVELTQVDEQGYMAQMVAEGRETGGGTAKGTMSSFARRPDGDRDRSERRPNRPHHADGPGDDPGCLPSVVPAVRGPRQGAAGSTPRGRRRGRAREGGGAPPHRALDPASPLVGHHRLLPPAAPSASSVRTGVSRTRRAKLFDATRSSVIHSQPDEKELTDKTLDVIRKWSA
jgi:carbon monoxide dehydrogenase subunit G